MRLLGVPQPAHWTLPVPQPPPPPQLQPDGGMRRQLQEVHVQQQRLSEQRLAARGQQAFGLALFLLSGQMTNGRLRLWAPPQMQAP